MAPSCIDDAGVDGVDASHERRLEWTCDGPGTIECRAPGLFDEEHEVAVDGAGEVFVAGLLADTTYICTDGETEGADFGTAPLDSGIPERIATGAMRTPGYVLVNQLYGGLESIDHKLFILDEQGRVRWHQRLSEEATGDLDAQYIGDGRVLYGGAYGVNPTIIGLDHTLRWVQADAPGGEDYHHHARMLDDGTLLSMALSTNSSGGDSWTGVWLARTDPETDELVWSWDSQTAVDRGQLDPGVGDPWHFNSWEWHEGGLVDGALLSSRSQSLIWRLDTDTADLDWAFGWGGDFLPVDAAGNPTDDDWPLGQHDPELQPDGRLLVYDNGTGRAGSTRTRVAEYQLAVPERTASLLWTYQEEGWREGVWGDADRLDDGTVLVTYGHCHSCASSNPGQTSALVQLDTDAAAGPDDLWRVDFPDDTVGLYRAQWVSGCALFSRTAACP